MATGLNYRLPRMFGQQQQPPPTVPGQRFMQNSAPPPDAQQSDYFTELQKLRDMESPAETGYKQLLASQPKMEDYTPNRWQRMGAIFSGAGVGLSGGNGAEAAYNINSTPYREAQSQYTQRLGNSEKAASLEAGSREDKIKDLMAAREFGLSYGEYKRKVFETESKAATEQKTSDAALQRAQAYAQSIEDKNWDKTPQVDGSLLLFNRTTGQRRTIPANTIEAYTAQSGRIGANASAISAGASQQNANTNTGKLSLDEMNSGADRALTGARTNYYSALAANGGRASSTKASPGQQAVAIGNALDILAKDPKFAKFIQEPDDKGNRTYAMDDNTPAYKIFKQQLRKVVDDQLQNGNPFSDDSLDGMGDDVQDLGPVGR